VLDIANTATNIDKLYALQGLNLQGCSLQGFDQLQGGLFGAFLAVFFDFFIDVLLVEFGFDPLTLAAIHTGLHFYN
jgi:hypothetical protein